MCNKHLSSLVPFLPRPRAVLPITGARELDTGDDDWSSRLLECTITSTIRAGDWSSRLLEWDINSIGPRDGDGDAAADWCSRFPELDTTGPGRLTVLVGDWSSRFPESLASTAARPPAGPLPPSSVIGDATQSSSPLPFLLRFRSPFFSHAYFSASFIESSVLQDYNQSQSVYRFFFQSQLVGPGRLGVPRRWILALSVHPRKGWCRCTLVATADHQLATAQSPTGMWRTQRADLCLLATDAATLLICWRGRSRTMYYMLVR